MSVPYRQILRIAARRVNAITGTTASELESAYMTDPLTSVQIGNSDFTIGMIQDNLVSVIGTIIRTYAFVPNHPFRTYNISQTANIAHKGLIPSTNSAGRPVVGVWGAIRDSTTGEDLTEQPEQVISTIVDNTDSFLKGNYYYFKQVGERLYHTRTNVKIDVCTFSASVELASVVANGNAPIPDACLDMAWTGLVASLILDDEFTAQASAYGRYFESNLVNMTQGATAFAPAPVLINSQAPAIS